MTELKTYRLNIEQFKATADDSLLRISNQSAYLQNCVSVKLINYTVTGSIVAPLPVSIYLEIPGLGCTTTFNQINDNGTLNQGNDCTLIRLFLPGSDDKQPEELLHIPDASTSKFHNLKMKLVTYNPVTSQFEPFIDYTHAAFTFHATCYYKDEVVRRNIRG